MHGAAHARESEDLPQLFTGSPVDMFGLSWEEPGIVAAHPAATR